jgi:hypothetical protein
LKRRTKTEEVAVKHTSSVVTEKKGGPLGADLLHLASWEALTLLVITDEAGEGACPGA